MTDNNAYLSQVHDSPRQIHISKPVKYIYQYLSNTYINTCQIHILIPVKYVYQYLSNTYIYQNMYFNTIESIHRYINTSLTTNYTCTCGIPKYTLSSPTSKITQTSKNANTISQYRVSGLYSSKLMPIPQHV